MLKSPLRLNATTRHIIPLSNQILLKEPKNVAISATDVVRVLRQQGITHIVWLPDSETNFMFSAMVADPEIDLVPVCREAESMAIAAGLWIGGKHPVVMIQNTGVFESGDSIRSMSLDLGMPLVMLIGYRGWTRHGETPDSAARFIEPVLHAFGIPYYLVESSPDLTRLGYAFNQARTENHPVAVLFGEHFEV